MEAPGPLTPPAPEVAEEDKDEEEELDDEPPFDEWDLQHEHLDADSAYGDDAGSRMNYGSISESIYNFREENGRTYHAYRNGHSYVLPNDLREQYRMDLAYHSILRMFDGKPFFAPIENPQRIVDMGTGTGIWVVDVGDQYPSAHVLGIDISPIQPSWVPPNVEFRYDDINLPWVYEQPIDLVHSRICSGLAIRDWPKYLSESYRCLRPGGWVEAQEFYMEAKSDDDSFPPDSAIIRWHEECNVGFSLAGCNMRISAHDLKSFMKEAGFVNIQMLEMKWPMSPWNEDEKLREAGLYMMDSTLRELRGISLEVLTKMQGWKIEDMDLLLAKVKKEWFREDIHGYWPLFVVYGQKPLDT